MKPDFNQNIYVPYGHIYIFGYSFLTSYYSIERLFTPIQEIEYRNLLFIKHSTNNIILYKKYSNDLTSNFN